MRFRILLIAGLACYWPFFRSAYFGSMFAGHEGALFALMVLYAALGIAGGLAARFPTTTENLLRHPGALLFCAAGTSGLLYGMAFAGDVLAYRLGAAMVVALCAAGLSIAWALACTERGIRRHSLILDVALSFLTSFVVTAPAVAAPALEGALMPVLPFLSATALAAIGRPEPQPRATKDPVAREPLLRQTALLVIVASVLVGLHSLGVANHPESHTNNRYWASLAFGFLFVLCVLIAGKRPTARTAAWGAALLLIFAGTLSAIATGADWREAGADAIVIGRLILWVLYWALLVESARESRTSAVFLMGLYFLVLRSASLILADAISAGIQALSLESAFVDGATLVASVALLAVAFVFVGRQGVPVIAAHGEGPGGTMSAGGSFLASDSVPPTATASAQALAKDGAMPDPPSPSRPLSPSDADARETACCRMVTDFNLTEREAGVLVLLSQGHTMRKVGEELFISLDTAKTHARSLYRKLGVHSKQELIDLVNERIGS